MLSVLAQFPESPDGCHCDRLRGEEHRGRLRNSLRSDRQSEACGAGTRKRAAQPLKSSLYPFGACVIAIYCHTSPAQITQYSEYFSLEVLYLQIACCGASALRHQVYI